MFQPAAEMNRKRYAQENAKRERRSEVFPKAGACSVKPGLCPAQEDPLVCDSGYVGKSELGIHCMKIIHRFCETSSKILLRRLALLFLTSPFVWRGYECGRDTAAATNHWLLVPDDGNTIEFYFLIWLPRRWGCQRKTRVDAAIGGTVSQDENEKYRLSIQEFFLH
jgi:hypothetical protein